MRHRRLTNKLSRNYSKRQALLENLVSSLLVHQQIKTTLAKAKAAQRLADRVITLGKADTLHARRRAYTYLQDHDLTSRLFKEVAPRFKERKGGYTRVLRLERRKGDQAQLALLELTERAAEVKKEKKPAKKAEKGQAQKTDKPPKPAKEQAKTAPAKEAKRAEKQAPVVKREEPKQPKPKMGFIKSLGRFFKRKSGG